MALVFSAGCDPLAGVETVCNEDHSAVTHARSLSEEQLSFLYAEMFRIRAADSEKHIEYGLLGEPVPESLEFLEAARIRPSSGVRPNIMLAGCMDEFIYLRFFESDEGEPRIELSWAAGTSESPYHVESQILWQKPIK